MKKLKFFKEFFFQTFMSCYGKLLMFINMRKWFWSQSYRYRLVDVVYQKLTLQLDYVRILMN